MAFQGAFPVMHHDKEIIENMKKQSGFFLMLVLLFFFGTVSAQEGASRRLYTVTAPYLTVTDDISFEGLSSFWKGECDTLPGTDGVSVILIPADETDALSSVFGEIGRAHV